MNAADPLWWREALGAPAPAPAAVPASGGPPPPSPDHADAPRMYGSGARRDVPGLYARLRALGPVAPVLLEGDVPAWFVSGVRELRQVMGRPEWFSRDHRRWNLWDRVGPGHPVLEHVLWSPPVLFGEDGGARADAIGDALAAVDGTDLRDLALRVSRERIGAFAAAGGADLVTDYARHVPARVFARLCGLEDDPPPPADLFAAAGTGPGAVPARRRLHGRLTELVVDRRRLPRADPPSRLAAARPRAHPAEPALDLLLMLVYGQAATADWIATTLRLALAGDGPAAALAAGRTTVPEFLREALWRDTPARNAVGRWAVQDCDLGGRRIRRGDLLVLGLAAAGTDAPRAARERPGIFFGHGERRCPHPAPRVAAAIAAAAVETALEDLPDLRAVPPAPDRRPSPWAGGPDRLPVAFTPRPRCPVPVRPR
ncbi:cytochrome P450 family protein [Nocardiopsis protaetiae]|uniref:cytochrome P450 n=1 Tax=Nocardiopsis protaetiae TaxID=3382270 RepID=UPI00387A9A16